jgi:hypothetical protein
MLNKIVCICCSIDKDSWFVRKNYLWNSNDDRRWVRGFVLCPSRVAKGHHSSWDRTIKTNDVPPHWCPRRFEHMVALGMTNA